MVATIRKPRKSTPKKNSKPNISNRKIITIIILCILILGGFSFLIFTLNNNSKYQSNKIVNEPSRKTSKVNSAKNDIYDYTEILENKEILSGSGVKNNKNYEAETRAKEEAYRKAKEERRKQELEKKKLAEERLKLQQEQKKLEREKKELEKSQKLITQGKNSNSFLRCDNYRTLKEAEEHKAQLAFLGKESIVSLVKIGGGYVYSLDITNCTNQQQCEKYKQDLLKTKIVKSCHYIK